MIGITGDQERLIREIFRQHLPSAAVWVFGSRVKGPVKESSDLDLAIYPARPISLVTLGLLNDALSEAPLPFRVDCIDTTSISPEFFAIIESCRERFV